MAVIGSAGGPDARGTSVCPVIRIDEMRNCKASSIDWSVTALGAPAQRPLCPSQRPRIARPAAPRLRGLRQAYLGDVEGANLIKLHRQSGKVSYLVYPDFETDPHPALLRSIKLNLRTREIESTDYAPSPNPPVLHRKQTFLLPDHPLLGEVRAADAPGGAGRVAGPDRDDRHAGGVGGAAALDGLRPPRPSARSMQGEGLPPRGTIG